MRRFLHWDDDSVVLHGGTPAARGEPPRGCVRGLKSIAFSWGELERVRLVEPFPSVEFAYRFERGRQTEVVRPERAYQVEGFAVLVREFLQAASTRPRVRVDRGWEATPCVPFEFTAAMPNDPRFPARGGYRRAPRPGPLVAYRWRETVAERWRVTLWRGEALSTLEGAFEQLLLRQEFPWAIRGSDVALTYEHAYVSGAGGGGARVPLDTLRQRLELPHLRLYVFGRRTVLAFAERHECPVQDALDGMLRPRLRVVSG